MRQFLIFSLCYFFVGAALVIGTQDTETTSVLNVWGRVAMFAPTLMMILVLALCMSVIGAVLVRRFTSLGRNQKVFGAASMAVVQALCATFFFHLGFPFFKTSMPMIVPFFADDVLAEWDKFLHGGKDAWVWAYEIAPMLPMELLTPFYLQVWVWPAVCLPIFLAVTDTNTQRVKRMLILYVMAWVLIGNVLALCGLSSGPVFYDRVYGGARFAGLTDAMAAHADVLGFFMRIQEGLWSAYMTQAQSVGSGISAFPSVHLSVSMVLALYLYERWKPLAILGAVFVVIILFLSVFSGYHYAVDGYVSIALIWVFWFALRRNAGVVPAKVTGRVALNSGEQLASLP